VRRAIALAGAALLAGGVAATAGAVTPPAGTPDLAQMVLAPADLTASEGVSGTGYITPPDGFGAAYAATLLPSATSDGVKYFSVTSEVAVAPDAAAASVQLAAEQAQYYSPRGRRQFVRAIVKLSPKHGRDHLAVRDFAYSGVGSAGIGDGSWIETLTVTVRHRSVQQVYLVYITGTYYVYVNLVGTRGEVVPQSDAVALGHAVAAHITSVAGATGSSGTTGTS
jgi:hypothetical protein